ncbi:MAG TPA: PQQ-binding-like beta-propeller repeat protein [Candidatus Polarisedimenticolaceae bacterium]|nr:PQQ-binding-like beta-propeller repeat protein [Candidatus Polarisedimenticolaceae bacterium]
MAVPPHRVVRTLAFAVVVATTVSPASAQAPGENAFDTEYLAPVPDTDDRGGRVNFRFELVSEVVLPGPLSAAGPRPLPGGVEIGVDGGKAIAAWMPESDLELTPRAPAAPEIEQPPFGLSADGRFRGLPIEEGWILAQRRCPRCKSGWRTRWKIRAPGSQFARPLVTEHRIYYGTTDNRVYCVKRKSGHRVWVSDVRGRVLRPLELLEVSAPPHPRYFDRNRPLTMGVILVIPDGGAELIALEAKSGERLASYELPENELLVGGAVAHDGQVVVAAQRYSAEDAALLVLGLVPVEGSDAPTPEVAVNDSVPGGSVRD